MLRILVLDNRDSFVYNLVQLLREAPNCLPDVVRGDAIPWGRLSDYQGVLLSPGPGLPEEACGLMRLIGEVADTHPLLGVCLGHQALAQYYGARIGSMARPLHGHASGLRLAESDEAFWSGVSPDAKVGRYHSWTVQETDWPEVLVPTAWSADDGVLMALRHRELPHYGVQFHPESIITDCGEQLTRNWLNIVARCRESNDHITHY